MYNKFVYANTLDDKKQISLLFWLTIAIWSVFIASIFIWYLKNVDSEALGLARQEAIVNFKKDFAFRAWSANHGGVYVPVTEQTLPNPYLDSMPERDIVTPSGRKLTLLNPAYMLRQLMENYGELYGVKSNLASLDPLNPRNKPDSWERKALIAFENGTKELMEITAGTQLSLRMMRPMIAQVQCLTCHLNQNISVKDVLGGVSVIVPLKRYITAANKKKREISVVFVIIWMLGFSIFWLIRKRSYQRIQERIDFEEKIWHQANFDALTGLANRNLFVNRLDWALTDARRNRRQLAILFIDLDRFKDVNDTRGHAVGDQLLQEAANRLISCVKDHETVSRLGGDEFMVILSEIDGRMTAALVAQKILIKLAEPFKLNGLEAHLTASIGITIYPQDGEDSGVLLKNADTAMYRAKAGGHNMYCFFTWEMNRETKDRVDLEMALRRALNNNELTLYYQPILNIHDESLVGAEALIRWQSNNQISVDPSEFIPLAEESGLIVPLGEWAIQQAAIDMAKWDAMGLNLRSLSVNVSTVQFRMADFCDKLLAFFKKHPHLNKRFFIEITESVFMDEYGEPGKHLNRLRKEGIHIAIDDFGTGYSSLGYLKRFPVDHIKIDHSFVRDVITDAEDAALCEAIIAMAHHLNLKVVAEGVETEKHHQFLLRSECDFVQGYYFSRPLSAVDFAVYMQKNAEKG